jgi:lipopolysaccharide cholinephosphotransferase
LAGPSKLTGKNLPVAEKMLEVVTTALEKKHIWYCLDGGTLLGIMREQRLLPWDNDIDLCVVADDCDRARSLVWYFRRQGYWVSVKRIRHHHPPMKKGDVRVIKLRNRRYFTVAGPVRLDIFIKYSFGSNHYWVEGSRMKETKKSVPKNYFDRIISTELNGKTYWIPEAYDEYLSFRYGDWRTPMERWNHLKDDGAIVKNEHPGP